MFSPDPLGQRPWHPDHFTHAYRALADEVGVAEPLKNLRHFNATQLLAAGVDLRTTAAPARAQRRRSDDPARLRELDQTRRPTRSRAAGHRFDSAASTRGRSSTRRSRARSPRSRPNATAGVGGAARARPNTYLRRAGRAAPSGDRVRAGSLPATCFPPFPTSPDTADSRGRRSAVRSGCWRRRPSSCVPVRGGRRRLRFRHRRTRTRRRLRDGGRVELDAARDGPAAALTSAGAARRVAGGSSGPGLPQARRPDPPGAAGQQVAQVEVQPRGGRRERPAHAADVRRRVLQPHPRGRRRGPPPRLRDDRRDPR